MAYIGNQPAESFTSFATQTFSVSATTSYTLDHAVANENEIALFVNNVRQQPGSGKAYTASGTALTLSAATASTDTMYCVFLGRALQTVTPATNSVTSSMLGSNFFTGATDVGGALADADLLLIDDGAGGTLRKTAASRIKTYIGSAGLVKLASTTISSAVPAVAFDNNYITSTYDNYKLVVYGLSTASDNQDVALQFSVDNGSNFATHKGHLNYTQVTASSDNTTGSTQNLAYIPIGSDEEGDDSGGINAEITIFNVNDTAQYTYGHGLCTSKNQNGEYYTFRVGGYIASNTAVNYLKVYTNGGGNLDKGTCTLYGITK